MKDLAFEHLLENENRHWWHVGKHDCVVRLLTSLVPEGAHLLDVGSSFGALRDLSKRGLRVCSLDVSREILARHDSNLRVCGDAAHLPFENRCFDAVSAIDLLEHLEDDHGAAAEMVRVLKPGGILLILVPAYNVLWSDLDEIGRHFRRYTPRTLSALFQRRTDVDLLRMSHFNTFLFFPILMVRILQRAIKRLSRGISTESMGMPPAPVNEALKRLFLLESRIVFKRDLPLGVSLFAILEKQHGGETLK